MSDRAKRQRTYETDALWCNNPTMTALRVDLATVEWVDTVE